MLGEDYWWEQRYDDAVFAERVSEGRCGNCGAFDGPTHRCPSVRRVERRKSLSGGKALPRGEFIRVAHKDGGFR